MNKITLTEKQRSQIELAALDVYPNEMCGFLLADEFIPVHNVHDDPAHNFTLDPRQYARYAREIIAIVHSHTRDKKEHRLFDLRTPSYQDMIGQKRSNVPWLIVGTEGLSVSEPLQFPRVPNNHYLQREFLWFINDCYTLVQDWYQFELGIELRDYELIGDYSDIRNIDDVFEPYINDYGFVDIELDDIQRGDLILLDNGGFKNNHLGIFTGSGILHQDTLSAEVPMATFAGRMKRVLRYVGQICKSCGGNNSDMPCAYPSENKPGCLKNAG